MSQGARVFWEASRSWRATDQNASAKLSSPATSRSLDASRSSVTGIEYHHLVFYPQIEVTSTISSFWSTRVRARAPPAEARNLWRHHPRIEISLAGAVPAAPGP